MVGSLCFILEKKETEKSKKTLEFIPNVIVKIESDQPTSRHALKVIKFKILKRMYSQIRIFVIWLIRNLKILKRMYSQLWIFVMWLIWNFG